MCSDVLFTFSFQSPRSEFIHIFVAVSFRMSKSAESTLGTNLKNAIDGLYAFTLSKTEKKRKNPSYDPSDDKFELFLTYGVPPKDHYEPTVVELPHRKRSADLSFCIFVPDGKKAETKELISKSTLLKNVSTKVLEVNGFRQKYEALPRKKELRDKFTLFLVDKGVNRRILLSLLGKLFLEKHFELFSADITDSDSLENAYKLAVKSACINWKGNVMQNIQIGSMLNTAEELYANSLALLQNGVLNSSPWEDIESIMVGEMRYNHRLFIYAHDFVSEIKNLPSEAEKEVLEDVVTGMPAPAKKKVKRTKRKAA